MHRTISIAATRRPTTPATNSSTEAAIQIPDEDQGRANRRRPAVGARFRTRFGAGFGARFGARFGVRFTVVITAAVIFGSVGLAPAQVFAHNYLVASNPEAGSVLTVLPSEFSVTTNDNLLTLGDTANSGVIEVTGPDGLFYGNGCVAINGPTISTTAALGDPGEYTMAWRVVSTDGHPVTDRFSFVWSPDAGQPLNPGIDSRPICPESHTTDGPGGSESSSAGEGATLATTKETGGVNNTVLWIIGALGVTAITMAVTFVLLRRKPADRRRHDRA